VTPTFNKALCLYAQANGFGFLKSVRTRIAGLLSQQYREFQFGDQRSHLEARRALANVGESFVIIFSHGGSDYVSGGEAPNRITGEMEPPQKFLERHDLPLFKNKSVFCMSCNSNDLGSASIEAGATAFVGFDEIRFSRYDLDGNLISNAKFVERTQWLIAASIAASLERFVTGQATLDEAIDYLQLWITQRSVDYVRKFPTFKERQNVAALLLKVRDGVRYHGQPGVRFIR